MENEIDIRKAARQLLEIDEFFAGDFTLRNQQDPDEAPYDQPAGLKEIAAEAAKCCQCGLGETRTNPVPGEGNPNARVVFVGEAPGADEDAQGRPFIGRAGKLLEKIINAMGFKRQDVYICNILKCRPPGNRDPKPDEIEKCLPFLHKQLELIGPEIIVALGAHAAQTLLETKKPIGQLRGKFHEYYTSQDAEPIKLMPTYHPAYLLRNYSVDNRRRVWEDMQKVVAELGIELPTKK
ncbi:MAG: uracil-DNA glycosylase [Planctomycetes bacterium]|nr:uracil-DNA glycosylase [Planctomycetota bacterium]